MVSDLSFTLNEDQPGGRLNVGIDMGKNKWVMDVLDTANGRHRQHLFTGPACLADAVEEVRGLVACGREVDVVYEAGRNGFTPARLLQQLGARVTVVPVNKLEVVNTGKKAKSDRLDARRLSERDARAEGFPSVWVPPVEQECRRRDLRERDRLQEDIGRNNNRILAILERWPVPSERRHLPARLWRQRLKQWRESESGGPAVPETDLACIANLVAELQVLEKNLAAWEKRTAAQMKEERKAAKKAGQVHAVDRLMEYKAIGERIALGLVWYVGDFERFVNGKKFASYVGLVPVPWASGGTSRCQGISKSGNPELRRLLIELAWLWNRHQPDSPITRKWAGALARKGRSRRTAIVAMARQLAVALFRLLKYGEALPGAVKNRPVQVPAATPDSPLVP